MIHRRYGGVAPTTVVRPAAAYTGRMRRTTLLILAAVAATLLAACAPTVRTQVPPEAAVPAHDAALAAPGPFTWSVEAGTLRSGTGCTVAYQVLEPVDPAATTVVWTHGFLRDGASMRGWGELAASHGLRSVVVSTCASSPFGGRHDRNAADLRAVANAVAGPDAPVLYAGFSAGGLASLLAAADDPRAVGVLGLDAVDSGGLAERAMGLAVPALFLAGEPSSCNAQGNLLPVVEGLAAARVVPVPYATHGDFELPHDPLVDRLCGRAEPAEAREALRAAIRGLAIGWLLERAAAGTP
jgi:pimeloyl-ACP methyl ester carboxylesterase